MLKVVIKLGLCSTTPVNLRIIFTGKVANSPGEGVLGENNDSVVTRSSCLARSGNGDYRLCAIRVGIRYDPLQMRWFRYTSKRY
jgi:hypothetical protein